MSKPNIEATGKPTPVAGCLIFLVIIGMVTFLAGVAFYTYFEHKDAVTSISEIEKKEPPLASLEDKEAIAALDLKMGNFESAVKAGKRAEITLSPAEMNLAIAHYSKLKPFRGNLAVSEIIDDQTDAQGKEIPGLIVADISFQVRAGFDGLRYVNGTMKMDPVIAMGSIFPIVTDIQPDNGNPTPPKYIKELPTFLFTEYRNDQELAGVFHKLSKVTLADGKMTILSDPTVAIEGAIPDDISGDVNQSLYLFGLLIFMFSTTAVFLLWVRKRKQNAAA